MNNWVEACAAADVDEEDLLACDCGDRRIAIYNTGEGFFATDLMCTHEEQSLEDGLVIDGVIECPLHGGRFEICSGKAISAPCTVNLQTYSVKVEAGQVFVQID